MLTNVYRCARCAYSAHNLSGADVCSRMLKYVYRCARCAYSAHNLSGADVCSRMLTYVYRCARCAYSAHHQFGASLHHVATVTRYECHWYFFGAPPDADYMKLCIALNIKARHILSVYSAQM